MRRGDLEFLKGVSKVFQAFEGGFKGGLRRDFKGGLRRGASEPRLRRTGASSSKKGLQRLQARLQELQGLEGGLEGA